MAMVVDASVAGCWFFNDEDSVVADAAFDRLSHDTACAPRIWWYEVRNMLLVAERRTRTDAADTTRFLARLGNLAVALDDEADSASVFVLARKHRLSVYDASYLELALRRDCVLATLDRRLAEAAAAAGIELLAGD